MKHFPVTSLSLPNSESERSREIIMDIKFHSVRDTHGSKSNLNLILIYIAVVLLSQENEFSTTTSAKLRY